MRPPPIRKGGPVSEIAYITLKPEVDFQHDANVIALWDEAKRMIAVQKGYGGSYQGTQFEDPSILIWVICMYWIHDHISGNELIDHSLGKLRKSPKLQG
jgi:hypothetical protein